MTKGAWLRWLENRYLQRHLHGKGIEIGALWRKFPVPSRVRVWYLDRQDCGELESHYPELRGSISQPDVLADAAELPVRPASLDFLIASHVLEHLTDPLRALRTWYETLAPGGVLLLKVPDKRYSFDSRRARTPLEHLVDEYEHPERFDKQAHYADWVENVGAQKRATAEFERAVQDLMDQDYSIHFHVWIDEDLRKIVEFTQQNWKLEWRLIVFWGARFYRKETTVLLVKAAGEKVDRKPRSVIT